MFLMKDGTLISLFHGDAEDVCRPIMERLQVGRGVWRGCMCVV
jgi:hypothetical protein